MSESLLCVQALEPRFDQAARQWAARLNLLFSKGDVPGRDYVNTNTWGVAPSVGIGLNGPTRLFVSYFYQYDDNLPDYGLPYLRGEPAPVRHASNSSTRAVSLRPSARASRSEPAPVTPTRAGARASISRAARSISWEGNSESRSSPEGWRAASLASEAPTSTPTAPGGNDRSASGINQLDFRRRFRRACIPRSTG